jgi:outer membrane protein OmpA-like peptidoglycan-associated protein
MRNIVRIGWLSALLLWSAQLSFAQRRPPTEAEALTYIYSAFLTQADPAVMANPVVLGPELQRELLLPASADGAKVYDALIERAGKNPVDVRRATLQEVAAYGERRGLNGKSGRPLYTLEAGELRFLVQYDLQNVRISYVGRLGVADPDPRPARKQVEAEPSKGGPAEASLNTVAMRDARPQPGPLNVQWSGQFSLNSAELSAEARAGLDREILPQLANVGEIRTIAVSGHADRLGSVEYNRKLSQKRAAALRDYLVAKGVDESRIDVFGFGKTAPLKWCPAEKGAALIECLSPNRRVELAITAQ